MSHHQFTGQNHHNIDIASRSSEDVENIVVQLCHVADSQIRIKPLIKHSLFATFPCYSSYVVFTTCFRSQASIIRSLTIYIRTYNHLIAMSVSSMLQKF
jgi:hypothetical protein